MYDFNHSTSDNNGNQQLCDFIKPPLKILSSQSSHMVGVITIYPILQMEKLSLEVNILLYEDSVLEKELRPKDSISKSQAKQI